MTTRLATYLCSPTLAAILAIPAFAAETEVINETAQIPAGSIYTQNLTNKGDTMTLQITVGANTPLVLRVLNSEANALRSSGQEFEQGTLFEGRSDAGDTVTATISAGKGTWWIHLDNANSDAAVATLNVVALIDEDGKPLPPPPSPDGPGDNSELLPDESDQADEDLLDDPAAVPAPGSLPDEDLTDPLPSLDENPAVESPEDATGNSALPGEIPANAQL